MKEFARPRVVISRCLGFEKCRWNGTVIEDPLVEELKSQVEFVTVCPEVEIGLGVPREPIRIVARDEKGPRLLQAKTGRDLTGEMQAFVKKYLDGLGEFDGFILKDRSPSCGIFNVEVYPDIDSYSPIGLGSGFFGSEVERRFAHLPIETETRLSESIVREHFLKRVFSIAAFREAKKKVAHHGKRS